MKSLPVAVLLAFLIPVTTVQAQTQARVGVLPFKNASGKPQDMWLGEGFAESLTEGLLQIQSLNVVPQKDVFSVTKRLKISADQIFKKEDNTKFKAGEALGLDFMVIGAFRTKKASINAIALLVDVKRKSLIAECSVQGTKKKAFIWDLFDELIEGVTQASCFNVTVTASEKAKIKEVTKNTDALDAYEYYISPSKALSPLSTCIRKRLLLTITILWPWARWLKRWLSGVTRKNSTVSLTGNCIQTPLTWLRKL